MRRGLGAVALMVACLAHATDTFDGQYLTIPEVSVGNAIYTNVVIAIGEIIGVAGGAAAAPRDSFSLTTGQLSIPSVQAFGNTFTNVTITIAKVISVGGSKSARDYPVVDTHAHLDANTSPALYVAAALEAMQRTGITHTILMAPPMPTTAAPRDAQGLIPAVSGYQDKLFVSAGGAVLNPTVQSTPSQSVTVSSKQSFQNQANSLAAMQVVGFGEIAIRHLSLIPMGPSHPYEDTPGDHPLLLALADVAGAKGLPVDLHFDLSPQDMDLPAYPLFNPATPTRLSENLAAFERLLDYNKAAKFVWAHAGNDPLETRNPDIERTLLSKHPNLYMSLRVPKGGLPAATIFDLQSVLKPEWLTLLNDFPDRFVLGSDYFHAPTNARNQSDDNLLRLGQLLDQLPTDLAKKIAYQNAESLFKLKL